MNPEPDVNAPSWQPLPISQYQQRYWARWIKDPGSSSFNTSVVFKVEGDLDADALRRACKFTTDKHPALHATFSADGRDQRHTPFTIDEYFNELHVDQGHDIDVALGDLINQPFDLLQGPLFRLTVVSHGDDRYVAGVAHHIVADAVAAKILAADLMFGHDVFRESDLHIDPVAYSYADCVQAVDSASPQSLSDAEGYWRGFLDRAPSHITLPFRAGSDAGSPDTRAGSQYREIDAETTAALRDWAKQHDTTLFVALMSLYGHVLSRYAHQDSVVVSYPLNMRPAEHGHVLGCFVNLSLLMIAGEAGDSPATLLERVANERRLARPHQFLQLGSLIGERSAGGVDIETSYFSCFFGESHLNSTRMSLGDLTVIPVRMPWSREFDRDLRLVYDAQGQTIIMRADYRCARLDHDLIERFLSDLTTLMTSAPGHTARLTEIPLSCDS